MADHTKKGDKLAIINGATTDANAHFVNQGIHKVLDPLFKSEARIKVSEQWTPGWDPPTAQREAEQILTKENNNVQGFVAANDGMSGGIIAALKAQNLQGKVPTTGQDASLEGIQNVILGYQGVTAFKDIRLQATEAAALAAELLQGGRRPRGHQRDDQGRRPNRAGLVRPRRADRQGERLAPRGERLDQEPVRQRREGLQGPAEDQHLQVGSRRWR